MCRVWLPCGSRDAGHALSTLQTATQFPTGSIFGQVPVLRSRRNSGCARAVLPWAATRRRREGVRGVLHPESGTPSLPMLVAAKKECAAVQPQLQAGARW